MRKPAATRSSGWLCKRGGPEDGYQRRRARRPQLAEQVRQAAADMQRGARRPSAVSREIGALALAGAADNAAFHENFLRLLRYRDAVDTFDFDIPRRQARRAGGSGR